MVHDSSCGINYNMVTKSYPPNSKHYLVQIIFIWIKEGMQTSRKLFRLAKTLNEIQKILEIISNKGIDEFDRTF